MGNSKAGDLTWLKAPHVHKWYLGPLTDSFRRQAVCPGCWEIKVLEDREWRLSTGEDKWPTWGRAEYDQYKDEVEKRFFRG